MHKLSTLLGITLFVAVVVVINSYRRLDDLEYMGQQITPTSTPQNQQIVDTMNAVIADEDCTLPCWWGWDIGADNLHEVQATAKIVWGNELPIGESDDYIWAGLNLDETMNIEIEAALVYVGAFVTLWFEPADERLIGIRVYIGYPNANYANLEPYFISNILSKYGDPDEITFDFSGIHSSTDLTLRYQSIGLYVQYNLEYDLTTQDVLNDTPIRICNDYGSILEFQLQVSIYPNDANIPSGFWRNPAVRSETESDIYRISDLSVEAFTHLFSQPNQCFETIPVNELFAPTD